MILEKGVRRVDNMKKLSWSPTRKGAAYCSPACGAGCTWDAYLKAHDGAQKLADKLGPDWEPHVWENLGWHWSARRGGLKVHPHIYNGKIESYCAFLGEDGSDGGKWAETAKTPRKAIKKVFAVAMKQVDFLTAIIEAAK